jgi:hypothetical protein
MSDFPRCYWCIKCGVTGKLVFAGYFQLRGAVDAALDLVRGENRSRVKPTGPWIVIEPWFESREDEFRFWAEWWANQ